MPALLCQEQPVHGQRAPAWPPAGAEPVIYRQRWGEELLLPRPPTLLRGGPSLIQRAHRATGMLPCMAMLCAPTPRWALHGRGLQPPHTLPSLVAPHGGRQEQW